MNKCGMNWVRQSTRLAIYLRDGLACAYCGESVEDGARLTLDHLKPRSKGGTNDPVNLVTCCFRCNSSRHDRSWQRFAASVAEYLNGGVDAADIKRHVRDCVKRPLPRGEAKRLVDRRGSCAAVLEHHRRSK